MKKVVILLFTFLFTFVSCDKEKSVVVPREDARQDLRDYQKIATMILNKTISDQELEAKMFTNDEIVLLIEAVAELSGISKNEVQEILGALKKQKAAAISMISCSQSVEMLNGTAGTTYAFSYYKDLGCDNDPSDEDWTLQFTNYGVSVNPDYVKWWGSWYLRQVFSATYGGNLLACDLCSYPIKICLGTNGVALAGGINYVKNNLYIWHQ